MFHVEEVVYANTTSYKRFVSIVTVHRSANITEFEPNVNLVVVLSTVSMEPDVMFVGSAVVYHFAIMMLSELDANYVKGHKYATMVMLKVVAKIVGVVLTVITIS